MQCWSYSVGISTDLVISFQYLSVAYFNAVILLINNVFFVVQSIETISWTSESGLNTYISGVEIFS